MKIKGGIATETTGLQKSIEAMHMQTEIMGIISDNMHGFDKIGFQRKKPVVSSFAEYLGSNALSTVVQDDVGRIAPSEYPLDVALTNKGYFQFLNKDGSIKLSRDGRFHLNKYGELLSIENQNVLSAGGNKIVFDKIPDKLEDIKINLSGEIQLFNPNTRKFESIDKIGVLSSNGGVVMEPEVRQGFLEASNVVLAEEVMEAMPVYRNFQANRQMFMIQSSNLSNAIQQLGNS